MIRPRSILWWAMIAAVHIVSFTRCLAGTGAGSVCQPVIPISSGPDIFGYDVFFGPGSAMLTDQARVSLDSFLKEAENESARALGLFAHTDVAENVGPHHDLDQRRANAVRGYIQAHGFNGSNVFDRLFGSAYPRIPPASGKPEPLNRRVELEIIGYNSDPYSGPREHRKLLCRRWVLDNCIGPAGLGREQACRSAIDFLVRVDDVQIDLEWRTKFVQ